MNNEELMSVIKVGDVFQNPGGGTSIITGITEKHIYYKRKKSTMSLPIDAFSATVFDFSGRKCSSTDLKKYKPDVFSTKNEGHDCNCTFLFCVAEKMGLIENSIQGRGEYGSPFYVVFK